ncbi:MAG: ribulose-phosphate 3-epimerase [Solirubrobacteraceae bacterium]|nr:ribulose-phosphate 3-epimerase [Solirubrobacteraceae bacterium]
MPADPSHAALKASVEVAPSILSADFAALGSAVEEVIAAGARVIHCDVMDGHFVPPITFGAQIVGALRDRLPDDVYLDVHLMITAPERHVADFISAGADGVTFHQEATPHVHRVLQQLREAGVNAGLAVCPGTPIESFEHTRDLLDLALCMTVNPGWGGQKLIPSTVDKTAAIGALLDPATILQVDGGVDLATAPLVAAAGARWMVAGSAVFGKDDPGAAFQAITEAARAAAPTPA